MSDVTRILNACSEEPKASDELLPLVYQGLRKLAVAETVDSDTLLYMDEAIEKLAKEDPESAELVKLRFFIGFEMTEIANTMGVPERAAYRIGAFDRAWLNKELSWKFTESA